MTYKEIEKEFIDAPCCKVCACENGKKIHCACHRRQLKNLFNKVIDEMIGEVERVGRDMTAQVEEYPGEDLEIIDNVISGLEKHKKNFNKI